MAKDKSSQSQLTQVHHVGIVVRDMNKAIERLQFLGVIDLKRPSLPPWFEKMLFRGKTFDTQYKFFGKGPFVHPSMYKVLEIGPQFYDPSLAPLDGEMLFHGKPFAGEYKIFKARLGGKIVELFEPTKGPSPWQEYLEKYGEGIHHIAFEVENLDKEIARLVEQGAGVVLSGRLQNGGGGDYLDFGSGLIVEVFKYYY